MQGRPTIAVIGGTGDLGSALASRWAAAGYPILLGSRSKEKAEAAAREMNANHGSAVSGEDNRTAAAKADIVVVAVPYANHDTILNEIKPVVTGKIVEYTDKQTLFTNPLHPYTEALLAAVPVPNPRVKRKKHLLQGDVPSPINPPSGCTFHTRCPYAEARCKSEVPALREVSPGHQVACHLR